MEDTKIGASAQLHSNFGNTKPLELLGLAVEKPATIDFKEWNSLASDVGCDLPLVVSMFADVNAQQIRSERLSLRQLHARLGTRLQTH